MKYFIGVFCFLSLMKLSAQEVECYCYENSAMKYTEWLYMMDDSVIVVGQMNKICEDLDVDNMLKWARSGDNIWLYSETNDQMKFTKVLSDPKTQVKVANYLYTGVKANDGLEVIIKYSNNFTDAMGPPNRFYKRVKLNK